MSDPGLAGLTAAVPGIWSLDQADLPTLFEVVEDYQLALEMQLFNPIAEHRSRLQGIACRCDAQRRCLTLACPEASLRLDLAGECRAIALRDERFGTPHLALEIQDRDGTCLARLGTARSGQCDRHCERQARIWDALIGALIRPISPSRPED